jgi:tetratricopeptide (TPR) repeat protein
MRDNAATVALARLGARLARGLVLSAGIAWLALAQGVAPASADSTSDQAEAAQWLTALTTAGPAQPRQAAAEKLRELAPRIVAMLGSHLQRAHSSTVEERRAVLEAIGASIPDASGKFSQPKRLKSTEIKAEDEVDWLPALLALDPRTPVASEDNPEPTALSATAISEVIADVAVIRALAGSGEPQAAAPLFAAAFSDATMAYRDECGRYLRKMEPISIPVLTKESQGSGDRRRYATYQLERLDRQDPAKALSAATKQESLVIAILDTFRVAKHREAVYAVYDYIDHDSPRIRAAARAAWLAYVTGRPPPPAPKRKMVLPGGKEAEKETPLWLTYRELAEEKLRKVSEEVLGDPVAEEQKVDVAVLSKRVFDHFDAIRSKRETEQWTQAKSQASSGDLAGAVARIDQLLAVNPERNERTEMAELYFAHGKALQQRSLWDEAAAAFSKAQGMAGDGALAKEALAARDFALGKAMEAQGQDGTGLFRRAAVTKPDFEEAAEASTANDRPGWMLWFAALAGLLAVGFAAVGASRRRRVR